MIGRARAAGKATGKDAQKNNVQKKDLCPLITGLYRDAEGILYLKIREFLRKHHMPDRPEVRAAILDQIRIEFGNVEIVVVENDEETPNQTS